MEDFQERVVKEKEDLSNKWTKLIAFMHTDTCGELSAPEQGLLMMQQMVIENYITILRRRIELFQAEG